MMSRYEVYRANYRRGNGQTWLVLICVCVCVWVLSTAPTLSAEESVLLRWKFKPAQKFDVKMVQTNSQAMVVGDEKPTSTTEMRLFMTWVVDAVDDQGVATVTQTTDRIVMDAKMPAGSFRYDSADSQTQAGVGAPIAGIMKSMVGTTTVQRMNDRGEILQVKLPEDVAKSLVASPAGQAITEKSFTDMMRQTTPMLPEKAVTKGSTWSQASESNSILGPMKMTQTFSYAGPETRDERTIERIDIKYDLGFGSTSTRIQVQQQDNQGAILFDNITGYLAASEVRQDMKLKINVQDQSIEQEISSSVTMTVTPIAAE